ALAAVWGAHSAVAPERQASDLLIRVSLALVLGIWATTDARRRKKPIPLSSQFWFFILSPIVVPGYVIVTRGWKGVILVLFHTVAGCTTAILAMPLAGWLYFGDDWWAWLFAA